MIGIIGAMDVEVEGLKALLKNPKQKTVSGIKFVSGNLGEKEVVIAKCGVGKVFAAICTEAMILTYAPELIINIGVAGGLSEKLSAGDIVIADSVVQHDMDTSPLGEELGFLSGIDIVKIPTDKNIMTRLENAVKKVGINHITGTIASGDQFVADQSKKDFIIENFGAVSCEMEGASVGHVCYVNSVPFCVLRAISDGANGEANMDFFTFTKIAAKNSIEVIKQFVGMTEE